ncbi:transporter [Membranihabitans marinus]|uniref:transporter n=1 Tax=Membranihabitans marinus TaxID=1227546 RepID=UPI001F17D6B7|nr:transporter [Membranihabitans marinus]
MNLKNVILGLLVMTFFAVQKAHSQGMIDGFYNTKGQLSLTASYTGSKVEDFYVGTTKASPVPALNTIEQSIVSLYAKYALMDNLSLIVNAPFISSKSGADADPVNGETKVSGFQDISLAAKLRPFSVDAGAGSLDGITSLTIGIPTGYEANGILSNGNGAFSTDLHVGAQYNFNMGLFATAMAGYSFRGEAENTFKTAHGNKFDVPNAFLFAAKIGYAGAHFYIEGWMDHQSSSDGVDIMGTGFDGNFPETKVNYTRFGATAYVPITKALGVSVGFGSVTSGRNISITNYFNGGITLNFDTM